MKKVYEKMSEKKIAVIAGHFGEYRKFCADRGDDPKYIYATEERLRGLTLEDVVCVGTWYEDHRNHYLLRLAKTRIR